MVRRLGDEHDAEQVQHHPHGAHDAKRNIRRERAERVRIQYAGDYEELKYRAQTTYTIKTNTVIVELPNLRTSFSVWTQNIIGNLIVIGIFFFFFNSRFI